MTPALLLAGVVIVIFALFLGLWALRHKGSGRGSARIKITLVPPAFEIYIEHSSD